MGSKQADQSRRGPLDSLARQSPGCQTERWKQPRQPEQEPLHHHSPSPEKKNGIFLVILWRLFINFYDFEIYSHSDSVSVRISLWGQSYAAAGCQIAFWSLAVLAEFRKIQHFKGKNIYIMDTLIM